eukprot:TRINITY_DN24020_c0_g1_i1.p1 TRINITY_DN24020_c0_g1~~TRINITY_DN24020_c0_g1_i1.p1  ORF type:complete len:1526 (-),score=239.18 TRINITY_DN24020_c0_g1_i1:98-4675(-)
MQVSLDDRRDASAVVPPDTATDEPTAQIPKQSSRPCDFEIRRPGSRNGRLLEVPHVENTSGSRNGELREVLPGEGMNNAPSSKFSRRVSDCRKSTPNDKHHADVIKILDSLDTNQDGLFEPDEIYRGAAMIAEMQYQNSLKCEIDRLQERDEGKLTKEDQQVLDMLKTLDKNGDGYFSGDEVLDAARDLLNGQRRIQRLRCYMLSMILMMLLTLGSMFGVSMATYYLAKETKVAGDSMRTMDGNLLSMGESRSNFPLGSLLFLPRAYRNNLDSITVLLKEKGTELDLKVLLMESTFSPKEFQGVKRPATRSVTAEITIEGLLYLSATASADSEGVINATIFKGAFKAAFEASLPAQEDDADHMIRLELSMELEDLGNPAPNPNASAAELLLAVRKQPKHVVAAIQTKFQTLSRAAGTQQGLKSMVSAGAFHSRLLAQIKAHGFDLRRQNYSVGAVKTTLLPQLRIQTHSGDELHLLDAGHAQLIRPNGHVEQFCASCTNCASLSVSDESAAETARTDLLADLSALDTNSGGGRRLETCTVCSHDFPQFLGGIEGHVLSKTGPAAIPCDSTAVARGQQLQASTYSRVPNMRAIRWTGHLQLFGEYQYESVAHCVEEAWLHRYMCQRNNKGEVTVAFIKDPADTYGYCHCLSVGASAEYISVDSDQTGVYTGTCSPEKAPYVVIPILFTVVKDARGAGDVSDSDVADFVESANELFRGDGEDSAHDTHIRFFLKGIRRLVDDAFYHQCYDTSLQKSEQYSPDPEVLFHMYSCAGNEHDTGGSEMGGWALVGSTRLSRYFMEGQGVARLSSIFKNTKISKGNGDVGAHEAGHTFGLKHTWGQGSGNCARPDAFENSDQIPDTAAHLLTTDCNDIQHDSCTADEAPGDLRPLLKGTDPVTNVMSYCASKLRFTAGQQRRMLEMIQRMRPSLFLRGAFTPLATGCSRATASRALGTLVTCSNIATETVGGIPFLDSLSDNGMRITDRGCACQQNASGGHPWAGSDPDYAECTRSCCNPCGTDVREWCLVDESCQGTNWGYCEDVPWTEGLELKTASTIAGKRLKKGSKIAAIKIGSGDWTVPVNRSVLRDILQGADSESTGVMIQFTIPAVGDCLWACVEDASCIGVIWNKQTHSCHKLQHAETAEAAEAGEVCYVRERYAQVLKAPRSIRLTTTENYPHQHSLITGVYDLQARLKNGRPVYRARAGELADQIDVSCLRVDPVFSWWTLVRGSVCDWVNPYGHQYAATASDAPFPESGRWELREIYSGENPTIVDVTIETEDSTASLGVCGDGVVSAGEECDDGNLIPLDGCSMQCLSEAVTASPPLVIFSPVSELAFDYATPTLLVSYRERGIGKCSKDSEEPPGELHHGMTAPRCAQLCANSSMCGGFSARADGVCQLWLASGLTGSNISWGAALCWEKVLTPCHGERCTTSANFSTATSFLRPVSNTTAGAAAAGSAPAPGAAPCPQECFSPYCASGSSSNGGQTLTRSMAGNVCNQACSRVYGELRYCGSGSSYEDGQHIDCSACR